MKALDKLQSVAALLAGAGVSDAAKEAEILVTEALVIDRTDLYSGKAKLTGADGERLDRLTARRLRGEPVQYLVGRVGFWGLAIGVGPGVLIPRPETELLVETVIKELDRETAAISRPRILDLCTGSGCIALALAKQIPSAIVYGVDRSAIALGYAQTNARDNGVGNVFFIQGDLFEPLGPMPVQCIVANPPYVRSGDIVGLQKEIRDFEPRDALDGGEDGLSFHRRIFAGAVGRLEAGGLLALEVGWDQAGDVRSIASAAGMASVSFLKDCAGIERIAVARA